MMLGGWQGHQYNILRLFIFIFLKKKKKLGLQEEKKKLNPFHSQGIAIPINGVQPNNKIVIP